MRIGSNLDNLEPSKVILDYIVTFLTFLFLLLFLFYFWHPPNLMPKCNVLRPLSNGLSDLRVLRSRRVILFQKNVAELIVPVFQFCAHLSCPAVSPWCPSNDPDDKKRSRNRRTRRKAKTARIYYCFLFGNVTFQQNRSRWKVKQHYFPSGKTRETKDYQKTFAFPFHSDHGHP